MSLCTAHIQLLLYCLKKLNKLNKMKGLKILLADPRHNTQGFHSRSVPINIGYIGECLKKNPKY